MNGSDAASFKRNFGDDAIKLEFNEEAGEVKHFSATLDSELSAILAGVMIGAPKSQVTPSHAPLRTVHTEHGRVDVVIRLLVFRVVYFWEASRR